MALSIGNKTFMNLQEAVGWLLENNALPFQSTANYVGNTEIAMSTLINPSPAKVRVGSIIFFADSKVSTVVGVTSNSFIVSDQYNDLVDDVVYVSNVALNASGHLIVTLSNGDSIDAGLVKQVTGFSINGSQHLIVSYNDGSTTDLGAIFTGNITISGSLSANSISSPSITEVNTGYSFTNPTGTADYSISLTYAGVVKTGNKITFVIAGSFTTINALLFYTQINLGNFTIPSAIGTKLFPFTQGGIANAIAQVEVILNNVAGILTEVKKGIAFVEKNGQTDIPILLFPAESGLDAGKTFNFRVEATFLLSDNLAS